MPIADLTRAIVETDTSTTRPPYRVFADYLAGRHQLKFATADFTTTHGDLLESLRENLCPMVRAGFTDTLALDGWGSDANDAVADAYGLDRLLGLVNNEAWGHGDAYVIVWPDRTGRPVPHFQRAERMIPYADRDNPAVLDMLVKRWVDPAGWGRATVLYPDHMERYVTADKLVDHTRGAAVRVNPFPTDPAAWRPYTDDGDPAIVPVWSDVMPACWWKLDADDVFGYGRSILTDVVPLQDGLNKALADLIVLSETYARPFWYLLKYRAAEVVQNLNPFAATVPTPSTSVGSGSLVGPDAPVTPPGITAPPRRRFDPNRQRIFTTPGEGPFGQLDPPDATKVIEIHTEFKTKVAGVVGLPMYYLAQTSGDVPSGQSLRVLSERRTARARRFQRDANPVLKGLGELLGMPDAVAPAWEPIMGLDPTEAWDIAEAQDRIGLDVEDILMGLDYPDAANVAARARANRDERATAARSGLFGV